MAEALAGLPQRLAPDELDSNAAEEQIAVATQWQLMWWRFRKHRLAMTGAIVLAIFYIAVIGADFLAYADPDFSEAQRSLMKPQPIHLFDNGQFSPYVYGVKGTRDPNTFKRVYVTDPEVKLPVRFFAKGFPYKILGVIPTDRHLIAVENAVPEESLFIMGTDLQGRDLWSRLMLRHAHVADHRPAWALRSAWCWACFWAASPASTAGLLDTVIQRVIEIMRSIPTIPLWMGLAAALPASWSVQQVYFAITLIISLIGWTELARVVRGRFLSLREEDFVMAARLAGCSQMRIIFRHMVPSFISHIIAATTLAIPAMIISETSLSFLGLGLRPPAISWGVLLQQAQNVQALAISPWLLIPTLPVVIVSAGVQLPGDGLRDAADPYG